MKRTYNHLSLTERELISIFKGQGKSINEIGCLLNRSPSTISRELKRNTPPIHKNYYLGHKADERAKERKSRKHTRPGLKNELIRQFVEKGLRLGWSPEQISGRLSFVHPGESISHETIYQYIYKERPAWICLLTRTHRKRYKRGHTKKHRNSHIPNRIPIDEHPKDVENREQAGHWESDTLGSRLSKAALVVTVERKTRLTMISKINQKTAENTKQSIIERLKSLPHSLRRSITYDNGYENVLHEKINEALKTNSFFCHPNASWQRGTVENTNGLIRRFFPKKTDFAKVKELEIKLIEFLLNTRPRKCLNYSTPLKTIANECCT